MYKTNHKKELMNVFEKNPNQLYSASELVEDMSSTMNKATVYRQLKALEDEDYIHKVFNPKDNFYEYQLSCNCTNHFHLVCKSCGKIIHLDCGEANAFARHIGLDHGFVVDQSSTTITGLCKECQ